MLDGGFAHGEQGEAGFVDEKIFICDSMYFYVFLFVICSDLCLGDRGHGFRSLVLQGCSIHLLE